MTGFQLVDMTVVPFIHIHNFVGDEISQIGSQTRLLPEPNVLIIDVDGPKRQRLPPSNTQLKKKVRKHHGLHLFPCVLAHTYIWLLPSNDRVSNETGEKTPRKKDALERET